MEDKVATAVMVMVVTVALQVQVLNSDHFSNDAKQNG